MSSDYFKFRQFTIRHDKCAMKVGTDGVLIGAWADCSKATRILDIGTGTGLIAIMLAQRSGALIDAVEIDRDAFEQAMENAQQCQWSDRISIIHSPFQDFAKDKSELYDLIVSNPPYFEQLQPASFFQRTIARHTNQLSFSELFEGVARLLKMDGLFCLILPYDFKQNISNVANEKGLYCSLELVIKPTPEKKPKRVMMEFSKVYTITKSESMVVESNGRHSYSDEYKRLTEDFYLNMKNS